MAAGADTQSPQAADERQAIQEANSLLQAEIKLAAKPQTYLMIDIQRRVVLVKARGLELHWMPFVSLRSSGERPSTGLFRLTARPPVDRPQAKPGEDATEHPIDLSNMPMEYQLDLDPSLTVMVGPPPYENLWLWLWSFLREGWARITSIGGGSWMKLTLLPQHARSLAWLVTDDMPVLVGRATLP